MLPVEERTVPQSTLEGEKSAPTQPFPTATPALVPQSQGPETVGGLTDADRKFCTDTINGLSGHAIFALPQRAGDPGDPRQHRRHQLERLRLGRRQRTAWIVSVSNIPAKVRMIPAAKVVKGDKGDLRAETTMQLGTPYAMSREFLRAPSGLPCIKPPFGELVALDLGAGKVAWRVPLGSLEELAPGVGHFAKGSIVLGGPIVTASGLIFQGGTMDRIACARSRRRTASCSGAASCRPAPTRRR